MTSGDEPKAPAAKPRLLSGGNPQIPKGEGDAPVQAYIAAMPGWKRDVGRRLDALIVRSVPTVSKAVKWNSPFYGIDGEGWFLSFRCFTKYVKVTFFRGTSLRPLPPGESKTEDTRYLDVYEDDELDEELVGSWIRQASKLPGWLTSYSGRRQTHTGSGEVCAGFALSCKGRLRYDYNVRLSRFVVGGLEACKADVRPTFHEGSDTAFWPACQRAEREL
jgi:hypothetical protein